MRLKDLEKLNSYDLINPLLKVHDVKGALTNGKLEDVLKTEYPERCI